MFYIGKHVSPSIPPVLLDEKQIQRVRISCGGGMGGSSWFEYGKALDPIEPNKIIRFRCYITGEVKFINTSFVVTVENKKVAKVESDCTRNSNFKNKKTIHYWLMAPNAKFELVDKCNVDVSKENAELIKTQFIY